MLIGHLGHIYFSHMLDGSTYGRLFSGGEMAQKVTEIKGQTDSRSHLLFLAISLIPIPPLHRPSYQNKIVISMAEALPFYWRLSDVRVIMSDLGFDRPTRERLVLQGESMAVGHIPINRLPHFFLLMLPALWQIRCFIRKEKKMGGGEGMGDGNGITHSGDSNKTFDHDV